MKKTFDEVVLFARTGLNPRQNFKLGQGKNKYITIKNIKNNTLVVDDNTDVVDDDAIKLIHKRSQIKKGDILFASIGRMGDMYIIEKEPVGWDINESVFAFTLNTNIVRQKYFYYIFKVKSTLDYLASNSSGSTFKSIKMNQLKRMVFDIPSLKEQDSIITILDKVCNVIEMRKRELGSLDKLIKARFVEMFGDPVANDMGWDTLPLENVCKAIVDCPHSTPSYTNEDTGFMCIRTSIVKKNKILWDDIEYISEDEFAKRIQRKKPEVGDIVYTREGAILGIAAIIDRDCNVALGQRSMLLSPDIDKCTSEFLCVAMNSDSFLDNALRGVSGSASPHINVGDIKAFKMIMPPIELQEQFSDFVKQVDKSKVAIQAALDKSQLLFDSLMQKYFG